MRTAPGGARVGTLTGSAFRDGSGPAAGIYGLDAARSPSGYPVFAGVELSDGKDGSRTTRTFALELGYDGLCDAEPDSPRTTMPAKLVGMDFELASRIANAKPPDPILVILQPTRLPTIRPFVEQVKKQASGTGLFDRSAMVAIGDGPRAAEIRAIQAEVAQAVVASGGRFLRGDIATGAMLVEMPAGEVFALVDGRLVSFAVSAAAKTVEYADNQEQREEFNADTFWDAGYDGSHSEAEIRLWPEYSFRWVTRRVHVGIIDDYLSRLAVSPWAGYMDSGPPGRPGERRLVTMWDCSLTYVGPPLGDACRPGFPSTAPPGTLSLYHGSEVAGLIAADFTKGQDPAVSTPALRLALSGIARWRLSPCGRYQCRSRRNKV